MADPHTSNKIMDPELIRETALQYCVDLLHNRCPNADFEMDMELKKLVHEKRMLDNVDNDIELTEDVFLLSLEQLEAKNKDKYKFIINGGPMLKKAIFSLSKLVWESEQKPDQWCMTKILQIFKGKGNSHEYENHRNIHTKGEIPKLFGHIVLNQVKSTIMSNMSIYQIGTRNSHRSQEHLFTMKSIIALHSSYNQPLIIQLFDVAKSFDCESLRDGLDALHNSGIKGKLYRLIHLLNKDKKITVKTSSGESSEAFTGENIGQGTVEGAVISAANIGLFK